MLRKLDPAERLEQMRWVCGGEWPPRDGETGFDPGGDWSARAWILNSIYDRGDIPSGLTHHDIRQMTVDAGVEESTMVNDVNLDEVAVTTGTTLGFVETPASPSRRVRWSDLGSRDGFEFWAVDGRWPHLRFTAQCDWPDPSTRPADSWPRIGPAGDESSWPLNVMPPTEGSLDEASLLALIDLLPLVRSVQDMNFTPSNIWPADRSWFGYTDYDLWATRISDSKALIDALIEDSEVDAVRCE